MLNRCSLIGFIPTVDAPRARQFYVDTLKLEFVEDDQFALVVRANGSMIRIVRLDALTPAAYTTLGWEVPDIASAVKELTAAGVSLERYPYLEQDELGIWTTPSGSRVAWFRDPDGNVLSLSQH